jgi:hypothetical protein
MRGAGGMLSTVDDLHAWSRALDGESVLSAEAKGKLWAPHVPEDPRGTSHYGYGWSIRRTSRGTPVVWHNGSNGVYYAEMRRYTGDGVLVIGASNVAEAMAEAPVGAAARLTFGLPVTAPPLASAADPARAAAAAGRYRLPVGGTISAVAQAGSLRLATEGADAFAAVRGRQLSAEAQHAGARTVAALDAANRDDFAPLHQALGAEMPIEALRAMYRDNMEAPGLGAARSVELVGTLPEGSRAIVIVRARMERGDVLLRLEWEGERLVGMDMMQAPGAITFLPAPDGSWVSYDLASGATVRLRVTGGVMEIETPSGPVRATRS